MEVMDTTDEKRYAVLLCAEDSEYVRKKHGGYFGVFKRMLAEAGERWDVYKVACGEFPEDDELGLYDGFVITGSCSDAYGNDTWIHDLLALLKKLDSMNKKILGICFGHQVIKKNPMIQVSDIELTSTIFSYIPFFCFSSLLAFF